MKLYFEPSPFYLDSHEAALPESKEEVIEYFLNEFFPEYKALNELNREIDAYIEQEKADHVIDLDVL